MNSIDEVIKTVYKCYLGKDLGYRTCKIYDFVKDGCGKIFFYTYSTSKDTILNFIKRCEKEGLL